MWRIYVVALILLLSLQGSSAHGQTSDLRQLVDAMRQSRTASLLAQWRTASVAKGIDITKAQVPQVRFDIYLDGKYTYEDSLNTLSLADVLQVALSFDPDLMLRGGAVGYNGVILVTSKKK